MPESTDLTRRGASGRFVTAPDRGRPLWDIHRFSALALLSLLAACGSAAPSRTASGGSGGDGGEGGSAGTAMPGTGGKAGPGGRAGTGGTGGVTETGGTGGGGTGGAPAGGSGGTPAPTPDAAVPGPEAGVAADGPPSPTPGCTGKFCDDFEGYPAAGAPGGSWKVATDRGMVKLDETRAFSGARSVMFSHTGAPAVAFIELRQPVLPLPGHVMHGRLMYYLASGPTGQYTHWEIVRGGGPLAGGARAQYNTGGENGKVVVNYEPGDCTKYSKLEFPIKRWACYQWEFNGPKNEIKLWVDGKPIDDVPVAPAGRCWVAPMVFDTVHIGWESYHGGQAVQLWIDDVAVGDQPIPCPTGMPSKP
jgi:hypothetical protein